jgi:hypothetical protein
MSLERLARDARLAPAPTRHLFLRIAGSACPRLQLLRAARKTGQLDRLIEAGAWTDAATTLIGLELPAWHLRRLVYDGGEWICSLSRQPNMPVEMDDTADARHEVMALAVLGAFVAALRRRASESAPAPATVPSVRQATEQAVCCDNFS